jgi:hypothetical protein
MTAWCASRTRAHFDPFCDPHFAPSIAWQIIFLRTHLGREPVVVLSLIDPNPFDFDIGR